jgi:hypothetical protein
MATNRLPSLDLPIGVEDKGEALRIARSAHHMRGIEIRSDEAGAAE